MTPPNESSVARAERAKKRRKVQREEKDRLEKAMLVIGTCYMRPDLYLEGDAEHKRVAKAVIAAANALQSYSTPSPPPFEPPPPSSSSSSSSSASSSDGPTSITSLMSVDNDLAALRTTMFGCERNCCVHGFTAPGCIACEYSDETLAHWVHEGYEACRASKPGSLPAAFGELTNRQRRFCLYRRIAHFYGFRGKCNRMELPNCWVARVKELYPTEE